MDDEEDFKIATDVDGNRRSQKPTSDPASGNPRPVISTQHQRIRDFERQNASDWAQFGGDVWRGVKKVANFDLAPYLGFQTQSGGNTGKSVDPSTEKSVSYGNAPVTDMPEPTFRTEGGTPIYASGSSRPDGTGKPNQFSNVPDGFATAPSQGAGARGSVNTVPASSFATQSTGPIDTNPDSFSEAEFQTRRAAAAERLERADLQRQLGDLQLDGHQSVGELLGNRAKAKQLQKQLDAFNTSADASKKQASEVATKRAEMAAEARENQLDRQTEFATEAMKAQADAAQPKVGATLEKVRNKLVTQGFGSLSDEEKFVVAEDLRKTALEQLNEEMLLNPSEDGPKTVTPEMVDERMSLLLGQMAAPKQNLYTGDAPPPNAPNAKRAADGAWYVPAQQGEQGAKKAKDGKYYKPVTQ